MKNQNKEQKDNNFEPYYGRNEELKEEGKNQQSEDNKSEGANNEEDFRNDFGRHDQMKGRIEHYDEQEKEESTGEEKVKKDQGTRHRRYNEDWDQENISSTNRSNSAYEKNPQHGYKNSGLKEVQPSEKKK